MTAVPHRQAVPAPLPAETRAAILADIRAGQKSLRQVARDHHVAPSTVHRIADEEGVEGAFERSHTKIATEAKKVDDDARQTALRTRAIDTANMLLDRIDRPVPIWAVGQDVDADGNRTARIIKDTIDSGPADWKNTLTAFGIAVDKSLAIKRLDVDQAASGQASGLLEDFVKALRNDAQQPPAGE